ncbi:hypothetical protein GGR56DRAFT_644897 [Xylariaceae sp. FL0804]|nr:hypothetical protein GGR56DRAFT_644897 [Xylariaceae sp. FL0804]
MENSGKRKHNGSDGPQGPNTKKSKGRNSGKWQTPHHKAKLQAVKGRSLEVGDAGVWTTCQRHKEMKALDELVDIFDQYGEKLYGIKPEEAEDVADDTGAGAETEDIEASIKNEIEGMKSKSKAKDSVFEPIRMNLDCLLFMRTRAPVDPVALVHEVCKDAKQATSRGQWRSRFINKFTPVTYTGRATEKGVEEVAKRVLGEHFQLAEGEDEQADEPEDGACSYAIRPSIRAHNTMKRTDVITQVAGLISKRHKVNLTAPDKVILIDIYQTFCGMSVVDGDWGDLKQFNLHELYMSAAKSEESAEPTAEEAAVSKPAADADDDEASKAGAQPEGTVADGSA